MNGFGQSSAMEPAVVRSKVHLALKDSSPKVGERAEGAQTGIGCLRRPEVVIPRRLSPESQPLPGVKGSAS